MTLGAGSDSFIPTGLGAAFCCAICFEALLRPVALSPCMHKFCRSCIEQLPPPHRCPKCRRDITRVTVDHDFAAAVEEAAASCTRWQCRRCSEVFDRAGVQAHRCAAVAAAREQQQQQQSAGQNGAVVTASMLARCAAEVTEILTTLTDRAITATRAGAAVQAASDIIERLANGDIEARCAAWRDSLVRQLLAAVETFRASTAPPQAASTGSTSTGASPASSIATTLEELEGLIVAAVDELNNDLGSVAAISSNSATGSSTAHSHAVGSDQAAALDKLERIRLSASLWVSRLDALDVSDATDESVRTTKRGLVRRAIKLADTAERRRAAVLAAAATAAAAAAAAPAASHAAAEEAESTPARRVMSTIRNDLQTLFAEARKAESLLDNAQRQKTRGLLNERGMRMLFQLDELVDQHTVSADERYARKDLIVRIQRFLDELGLCA